MAIEEAPYSVLKTVGDFELRQYEPTIVAETYVDGDFEKVGSEGFRRLVAYIGGKNRKNMSIAMTAPVTQNVESEKIAMTAPVSQEQSGNQWRITFLMPAKYTLDTLPRPEDERITLRAEAPRVMAVIRYSGTWRKNRYDVHEQKLFAWIDEMGWKHIGTPVWARYNPPFMPWFMRRNEILIPVQIDSAGSGTIVESSS